MSTGEMTTPHLPDTEGVERKPALSQDDLLSAAEPCIEEVLPEARPRRRSAAEALQLQVRAQHLRQVAEAEREAGDDCVAAFEARTAARMETAAERVLGSAQANEQLGAEASVARLELAKEAGVLTLALEASTAVTPQNSLEGMLAHQLAAAHAMAMRFAARAEQFLDMANGRFDPGRDPARSVEAARMASTSVRLMEAYQRGLLTLERLRHGGQQVVTVQHVTVTDGGQAVVAGTIAQRPPKRVRPKGGGVG